MSETGWRDQVDAEMTVELERDAPAPAPPVTEREPARPKVVGDFVEYQPGSWVRAAKVVDVLTLTEGHGLSDPEKRPYLSNLITVSGGEDLSHFSPWPVSVILGVLQGRDQARRPR